MNSLDSIQTILGPSYSPSQRNAIINGRGGCNTREHMFILFVLCGKQFRSPLPDGALLDSLFVIVRFSGPGGLDHLL